MIHWACCFLQYFYQKENIYDFNRIGQKGFCRGLFARYVSQNILGMLGLSAYVLADTFSSPWPRVRTVSPP